MMLSYQDTRATIYMSHNAEHGVSDMSEMNTPNLKQEEGND